jgi:two-component system cell cycle response regulator DivK
MKGRILIVDDDPVALGMLEEALKVGGFEVLRAYDAEDALRKVKLQKPDLVLTDLEMPKVNGVALIAMIREDPEIQRVPIIAVTSYIWDSIGQAAGDVGCDGYITKPFLPRELIQKVGEYLARRHDAPALPLRRHLVLQESKPVAAPPPVRGPAAVAGPEDTRTVFDRAAFLEYMDGNLDLAQRAIGVLPAALPDRLESIRKAVVSQDSEALREAAHILKGTVAFFAAPTVVAAALRLEMMGLSGDLTGAGTVYFDLERALARLVQALNEFVCEVGSAQVASQGGDRDAAPQTQRERANVRELHLTRAR